MKKFVFSLIVSFAFATGFCLAQEVEAPELEAPATIFDLLLDNTDSKKGVVILNQDAKIKYLVYKKKSLDAKKNLSTQPGFRVQIFSSNEQRTSKSDAYQALKKIEDKFPEMTVYVSYYSPFWKVRVGDCISTAEAQVLRDQIKKEFPEFQHETYIVKDQILLPEE